MNIIMKRIAEGRSGSSAESLLIKKSRNGGVLGNASPCLNMHSLNLISHTSNYRLDLALIAVFRAVGFDKGMRFGWSVVSTSAKFPKVVI
jgi:hypothetical protein